MLRCLGRYVSSYGSFQANDLIDNPELERALLADAPLMFVDASEPLPEARAIEDAPHRMVTEATPRTRTRRGH